MWFITLMLNFYMFRLIWYDLTWFVLDFVVLDFFGVFLVYLLDLDCCLGGGRSLGVFLRESIVSCFVWNLSCYFGLMKFLFSLARRLGDIPYLFIHLFICSWSFASESFFFNGKKRIIITVTSPKFNTYWFISIFIRVFIIVWCIVGRFTTVIWWPSFFVVIAIFVVCLTWLGDTCSIICNLYHHCRLITININKVGEFVSVQSAIMAHRHVCCFVCGERAVPTTYCNFTWFHFPKE